jgi:hypothetical protein
VSHNPNWVSRHENQCSYKQTLNTC